MRAQHQLLHHEALLALEARAGRDLRLDHAVLMDDPPRRLAAAAPARLVWPTVPCCPAPCRSARSRPGPWRPLRNGLPVV
jgi:hypothetical protein